MAEEKTQRPTAKKRRESKEKGQVAKSSELVSSVLVIVLLSILYSFGDFFVDVLQTFIIMPAEYINADFNLALSALFNKALYVMLLITLPIVIASIIMTIVATLIQIGPIWSIEPLIPRFEKINPVSGLKRIVSMRQFFEFVKSIVKLSIISVACFAVITFNIADLLQMPRCGISCILPMIGFLILRLVGYSSVVFLLISIIDILFQRQAHTKSLQMSKDEIKRELQETQANPKMSSQRQAMHKQVTLHQNLESAIQMASILITAGPKLAIVLAYNQNEYRVPHIIAIAEQRVALRLQTLAIDGQVPIVDNRALAQALLKQGTVNEPIPIALFRRVAHLLKSVQQAAQSSLAGQTQRQESPSSL